MSITLTYTVQTNNFRTQVVSDNFEFNNLLHSNEIIIYYYECIL